MVLRLVLSISSKRNVRSSLIGTHNTHTMERGCGTSKEIIMSNVELQARVREQKEAEKVSKLKYRGVTYKKTR